MSAWLKVPRLGSIEIGVRLGAGGMGRVYEGRVDRDGAPCAIKLLAPHLHGRADMAMRLLTEGRLAVGVQHSGVVRVLEVADAGEVLGASLGGYASDLAHPCVVMELLAGGNLALLRQIEGPLHPRRAVNLILDVLDALQTAGADKISLQLLEG